MCYEMLSCLVTESEEYKNKQISLYITDNFYIS